MKLLIIITILAIILYFSGVGLKLANKLTMSKPWKWFLTKVAGRVNLRLFGYPRFKISHCYEIKKELEKDPEALYAFVGADTHSLVYLLIKLVSKASWGHAGFIYVEDNKLKLSEMTGSGFYQGGYALDYFKKIDRLAIIKLPITKENLVVAKNRIKKISVVPKIDYNYSLAVDEALVTWLDKPKINDDGKQVLLYCSEYILVVGYGLVDDPDFKVTWTLKRPVYDPEAVYKSGPIVFEAK